jgi:hypothetical protein
MKAIVVMLSGIFIFFNGCNETINNNSFIPPVYYEILTINLPDNYTVKLYSADSDSLTYAYNEVYFKVWQNNAGQNTGYMKVYPQMRMTPHIIHSTPVSDSFAYNSVSGYYRGFIIFNMPTTPPDLVWRTKFTFVDGNGTGHETDSIPLYISYHPEKQLKYFYDLSDTTYYTLTLVKPFNPLAGLNGLELLLHKSNVYQLDFDQIRDALMYINVYKQDSLYSTGGNANPVIGPDGIYRGIINVPHKGLWMVADTIYYNGRIITNNPPPLPEININVE